MLLAGDVGGTKTLMGLFARGQRRPRPIETRTYRTLDFPDLCALSKQFLRDAAAAADDIEAASFGVAGPVAGARAQLTNIPWMVDLDALRDQIAIPRAHLLNDLEALAWSISVLNVDEIAVIHEGVPDPRGSVALIAAGTGLGVALLPNIDGRLVPHASEGGHADFAARTRDEQALANTLIAEYGRAEIERVVSGPGLVNIHRLLYAHRCATLSAVRTDAALPEAISRAGVEDGCRSCRQTLELFVSAYGAAAGNLALTVMATGGIYLGGGIAPRILSALRWPQFIESFLDKSPLEALVARIPVRVILNPGANLLGAATYANLASG